MKKEPADEPAEIYYQKGKVHFWVLTILPIIFFPGFSLYVSGKPEVSDKI
jgi:hypothetical protein